MFPSPVVVEVMEQEVKEQWVRENETSQFRHVPVQSPSSSVVEVQLVKEQLVIVNASEEGVEVEVL